MSDCPQGFRLEDGKCVPDIEDHSPMEPSAEDLALLGAWWVRHFPDAPSAEDEVCFMAGLAAGRAEMQNCADAVDALTGERIAYTWKDYAARLVKDLEAERAVSRASAKHWAALQKRIDEAPKASVAFDKSGLPRGFYDELCVGDQALFTLRYVALVPVEPSGSAAQEDAHA